MNFKRCFILMSVLASGLVARSVVAANDDGNPYAPIVTRNIFGLVPIPVHDPANDVPEPPPPKITPNGIMILFGKLQVLFKVAGVAKPNQPPKDESYVMGEGERQDEIEVQAIDEKSATITFNNHGTIQKLSLVAGTASSGAAPAAPGVPGGMPMPTVAPGIPGASPVAAGFGGRFGRGRPPGAGSPSPSAGPAFGGGGNSAIYNPAAEAAQQPQMTPEQQILMIEAQREKYRQEGNPIGPLLPPTAMTPPANEGGGDAGNLMPGQ